MVFFCCFACSHWRPSIILLGKSTFICFAASSWGRRDNKLYELPFLWARHPVFLLPTFKYLKTTTTPTKTIYLKKNKQNMIPEVSSVDVRLLPLPAQQSDIFNSLQKRPFPFNDLKTNFQLLHQNTGCVIIIAQARVQQFLWFSGHFFQFYSNYFFESCSPVNSLHADIKIWLFPNNEK